ncbi:MAG: LapA family protein [Mangrovibacterium sp.]|nr:LapA family protein [Mangrovibacterium sp.]
MSAGIIILLILALLLVIFTLQNTVLISLNVFFWQLTDVPLVLALIVCLIAGFLIAFFLYFPKVWRLKAKVREQQKLLANSPKKEETNTVDLEITGDEGDRFFNQ